MQHFVRPFVRRIVRFLCYKGSEGCCKGAVRVKKGAVRVKKGQAGSRRVKKGQERVKNGQEACHPDQGINVHLIIEDTVSGLGGGEGHVGYVGYIGMGTSSFVSLGFGSEGISIDTLVISSNIYSVKTLQLTSLRLA